MIKIQIVDRTGRVLRGYRAKNQDAADRLFVRLLPLARALNAEVVMP